jgi:transposase
MAASLRQIGLALGGRAGSRLAAALQLPTSRDSILHFVRLTPDQARRCAPRYLGVDDFCWRRGQTYGTILVDLESGRAIDLLPDRAAASFAAWLRTHPGAEIISRDRASAYSEGACMGAPQARQAADRFHLLKNLADALEELLSRLRADLRHSVQEPLIPPAGCAAMRDGTEPLGADTAVMGAAQLITDLGSSNLEVVATAPSRVGGRPTACGATTPAREMAPAALSAAQQHSLTLRQSRRGNRLACYEEVRRLHDLGWTQKAIGKQVNLAAKTIGRWLRHESFPERRTAERKTKLDSHKLYIRERCAQGCWNAKQICLEITEQYGYRGGLTRVREFVAELRQEHQRHQAKGSPVGGTRGWQLPSSRALKWLLMKPAAKLKDAEYALVGELCQQSREVTVAYGLVTDFQDLVRQRRASELASWVELALASGVREMVSFARGVQRDFAAVFTGMELEWNNGPVEGHVKRLKLLKRQGYGRAKFDLLRKRVLHAG